MVRPTRGGLGGGEQWGLQLPTRPLPGRPGNSVPAAWSPKQPNHLPAGMHPSVCNPPGAAGLGTRERPDPGFPSRLHASCSAKSRSPRAAAASAAGTRPGRANRCGEAGLGSPRGACPRAGSASGQRRAVDKSCSVVVETSVPVMAGRQSWHAGGAAALHALCSAFQLLGEKAS